MKSSTSVRGQRLRRPGDQVGAAGPSGSRPGHGRGVVDWVTWPPSSFHFRENSGPSGPSESKYRKRQAGPGRGDPGTSRDNTTPSPRRGFSPDNSCLGDSENSDDDNDARQPELYSEVDEDEEDTDEDIRELEKLIDLTGSDDDDDTIDTDDTIGDDDDIAEEEGPRTQPRILSTMQLTNGVEGDEKMDTGEQEQEQEEEEEEEEEESSEPGGGTLLLHGLLKLWDVLHMNKYVPRLADYQALRLVSRQLSRDLPVLRTRGGEKTRVCFSFVMNKSIAHNR